MDAPNNNVYAWATAAKVGERIVYATRQPWQTCAAPQRGMETAMMAHEEGLVFLAQRKTLLGGYEYEATRVSKRAAKFLRIHESI